MDLSIHCRFPWGPRTQETCIKDTHMDSGENRNLHVDSLGAIVLFQRRFAGKDRSAERKQHDVAELGVCKIHLRWKVAEAFFVDRRSSQARHIIPS